MTFTGLTPEVFDTYAPDKWSSMVHNLARMKAKQLMLALGDAVQTQLSDEITGLARAASDEIPNITNHKRVDSQWVYWYRSPEERDVLASFLRTTPLDGATIFNTATQDKNATLAIILNASELWAGVRIAPGAAVDRKNLASKLEKSWEREALLGLLRELPEGATCGLDMLGVANTTGTDALEDWSRALATAPVPWVAGHSVPRADALSLGPDLADELARWLGTMIPVYRFATWSRDNDYIHALKQIQEEKAQARKQAAGYKTGDKVRITAGLFSGKVGVVESPGAQVRVRVGKMSVVVPGTELRPEH